jgi:hypothetical protein
MRGMFCVLWWALKNSGLLQQEFGASTHFNSQFPISKTMAMTARGQQKMLLIGAMGAVTGVAMWLLLWRRVESNSRKQVKKSIFL